MAHSPKDKNFTLEDGGLTVVGSIGIGILGALILYFLRPQSDFLMLIFFGLVLTITSICLMASAISILCLIIHTLREAFLKDKP
jgi:hypothetical protein